MGGDLIAAVSYVEYELILDLKNICDFFRGQLKYDDIFLVVGVLVSEVFTLFGTVISRCHLLNKIVEWNSYFLDFSLQHCRSVWDLSFVNAE